MTRSNSVANPELSVIIPARNEDATLGACLQSLVRQTGVAFEIIVIDDNSSDRTRQIAQSFSGVTVITAPPLPFTWTGKNNAVIAGAAQAQAPWLLFTDADTVHLPGSLARSLAEAKKHGAALLSYSPAQEVKGFWEKAIMPVIFAELARTYRPSQVSDPNSRAAAANGQYMLVSREAYHAVGGHAAVANNLLEDVALAQLIKRSGRKIYFRYGGDAVRTRMYRSFAQLREGWAKNLAILFPGPLPLAGVRVLEFGAIAGGTALVFAAAIKQRPYVGALTGLVTAALYARFLARVRKAQFSWSSNLLAIFGLPFFSYLLWRSELSHKEGRVTWRGRVYAGDRALESKVNPSEVMPQVR